jgi:hypothetical protein
MARVCGPGGIIGNSGIAPITHIYTCRGRIPIEELKRYQARYPMLLTVEIIHLYLDLHPQDLRKAG